MTATIATSRRSMLGAVVVAAVMVVGIGLLPSPGAPDPATSSSGTVEADPVTAYLDTVRELARAGGRVVERGVKGGLGDLAAADAADEPDERVRESAAAWGRELRTIQGQWADVTPPEALASAHAGFVAALDAYVGVALVVEEGARVPPSERQPFVDLAVDEGTAADEAWNRSAALVQDHLRASGTAPVTWLPDDPMIQTDP